MRKDQLEEFKKIYKRKYGVEFSDNKKAEEAANNLVGFAEIILEFAMKEDMRRKKFEKEGKFHLPKGEIYNCIICQQKIEGMSSWWDLHGPKCRDCQSNLEKGIIPIECLRDTESWISISEFEWRFSLGKTKIEKLLTQNKLKSINLLNSEGNIYFQIFLLKDNPYIFSLKEKTKKVSVG